MVAFFKRPTVEDPLDARIAGLSARRQPVISVPTPAPAPGSDPAPETAPISAAAPVVDTAPAPIPSPALAPDVSEDERFLLIREELLARLTAELRPERLSILSRGELAKVVDAAVQAHLVRNGIEANPIARRDLITALIKGLLDPGKPQPASEWRFAAL
jgi:hypothetical protein